MSEVEPQTTEAPVKIPLEKIVEKLVAKGGGEPTCPICHTHKFTVGAFVNFPAAETPVGLQLGGRSYPTIAIHCANCGTMQFVNLVLLGFTEEEIGSMKIEIPTPPVQEKPNG
jgi:hypothetical protein